jgi:hypothetical protein
MTTATTALLNRALINLAAAGLRTHCSDPGTSELWLCSAVSPPGA